MKNKNLLAENMLRFRAKNLSETTKRKIVKLAEIITEQDQSNKDELYQSSNITLQLDSIMSGKKVARIDGNVDFFSFPTQMEDGRPLIAGSWSTQRKASALYKLSENQYIVVGNIGKLNRDYKVQGAKPLAFIVAMSQVTDSEGKTVRLPITPIEIKNPGLVIVELINKVMPNFSAKPEAAKEFVDNMINTFKLSALSQDISDVDKLKERILTRLDI